jgi:hypothetical protein
MPTLSLEIIMGLDMQPIQSFRDMAERLLDGLEALLPR